MFDLALVVLVNCIVVGTAVAIHYEFLYNLTTRQKALPFHHRTRIVFSVLAALVAHALEVWVFGVAYYYMNRQEGWGTLEGNFDGRLLDCVYYSFTTFTTLGFGDIVPHGDIRYLTGIESLTGLVLITWTASFLYLEMQRHWREK